MTATLFEIWIYVILFSLSIVEVVCTDFSLDRNNYSLKMKQTLGTITGTVFSQNNIQSKSHNKTTIGNYCVEGKKQN